MNLNTFFDNFELLAEAPNRVKKLRELILQLAVMGKLAPQDPNEEPASILIRSIQAKKEQLINEKKVKNYKYLSQVKPNCIPYELPKNWKWIRLDEISDIGTGSTPLTSTVEYYENGNIAWITSSATSQDFIHSTESYITPLAVSDYRLRIYKPNTLIVALYGQGKTRGQISELNIAATINQACAAITFFEAYEELGKYIKLVFKNKYEELRKLAAGGAQPNLNVGKIKETLIPLPPLAEQHRIVAKVDELMKLCDELEAQQQKKREAHVTINNTAIAQLLAAREPEEFNKSWQRIYSNFDLLYSTSENIGKLRQAILQLAVMGKLAPQDPCDEPASILLERIKTKKEQLIKEKKIKSSKPLPQVKPNQIPYKLPNNWEWVRLHDISDIGTGSTPLTSTIEYYENGNIPWITSSATSQDFIYSAESYITSLAVSDYRLRIYKPNTLIVALYGQGKTRGQVSELKISATINQACAAISFFEGSEVLGKYIKQVFRKKYDELRELAAGGAQPNLNVGKIKETLIPLPPLAEQHRIITKVKQLMSLCDQLEAQLKQSVADSEKLMETAVRQMLDVNTIAADDISTEATKLETKTVKQSSKKTQSSDGEVVQLNLPLF